MTHSGLGGEQGFLNVAGEQVAERHHAEGVEASEALQLALHPDGPCSLDLPEFQEAEGESVGDQRGVERTAPQDLAHHLPGPLQQRNRLRGLACRQEIAGLAVLGQEKQLLLGLLAAPTSKREASAMTGSSSRPQPPRQEDPHRRHARQRGDG